MLDTLEIHISSQEMKAYYEEQRKILQDLASKESAIMTQTVATNGTLYSINGGRPVAFTNSEFVIWSGDTVIFDRGGKYQSITDEVVVGEFYLSENSTLISFRKPPGFISSDINFQQVKSNRTAERILSSRIYQQIAK